jgi:hypothetical protein
VEAIIKERVTNQSNDEMSPTRESIRKITAATTKKAISLNVQAGSWTWRFSGAKESSP